MTDDDTSDGPDANPAAPFTYGLEGADKDKFHISAAGVLTVCTDATTSCGTGNAHLPNYEKQSSYAITITAMDDEKAMAKLDVTVKVINAEDTGSVMLSQREPQENRTVSATLKDEDGGLSNVEWQWYWNTERTTADTTFPTGTAAECDSESTGLCFIKNAKSPSYTPKDVKPGGSDNDSTDDWFLVATVTYNDALVTPVDPSATPIVDAGDKANLSTEKAVQASEAANTAPKFPDQDPATPGDQSDTATRSVAENQEKGASIGDAVDATDADGDALVYSIGGPDAASFEVVSGTGYGHTAPETDIAKIKTAEKLDYETKSVYTIVLVATDPSGATDTITITVNVTDVDDAPVIGINGPPAYDAESADRSVDENSEAGAAVGDPVAATDPNGDTLSYELGGDDAMSFAIDGMGQITVAEGAMLDYEAEQNTYVVTVTASDPDGEMASITVNIAVADVKENNAPAFASESMTLTVPENSAGINIGDPVAATDPDEGDELEYSITDESGNFAIDSATGQVSVIEGAMLDHEAQASYMVVVMASDGEDSASVNVTISVTNVGLDNAYDTDDSGSISKAEAVNAVQDYFDDMLSRDGVLEVIRIYFG